MPIGNVHHFLKTRPGATFAQTTVDVFNWDISVDNPIGTIVQNPITEGFVSFWGNIKPKYGGPNLVFDCIVEIQSGSINRDGGSHNMASVDCQPPNVRVGGSIFPGGCGEVSVLQDDRFVNGGTMVVD